MRPGLRRFAAAGALLAALGAARTVAPEPSLWMGALAEAGPIGGVGFVVSYAAAAVLALPGAPFTLAAGFVWGMPLGLALAWSGATLGAGIAFGMARAVGPGRWDDPRIDAVDRAIRDRGLVAVLLMRLSPAFPFNLLNYALGLSGVRPRDYAVGTALGMLPGAALYTWMGALARDATLGEPDGARLALGGVGLAAAIVVVVWIGRAARRELAA